MDLRRSSTQEQKQLDWFGGLGLAPVQAEVGPAAAKRDETGRPVLTDDPVLPCPSAGGFGQHSSDRIVDALRRWIVEPFVDLEELRTRNEFHACNPTSLPIWGEVGI